MPSSPPSQKPFLILICVALHVQHTLPQRRSCFMSGYTQRSTYVWLSTQESQTACFTGCLEGGQAVPTEANNPQYMFEGKFIPKKISINCDFSARQFSPYCLNILKNSVLPQSGTRRYFFAPGIPATFFEAHKFCRRRGLSLGTVDIKAKELEIISLIRSSGVSDKGAVFWGEYRIVNATFVRDKIAFCYGFSINEKDELVRVETPCANKTGFFCDVPVMCYTETCIAGTGVVLKPDTSKVMPDLQCTAAKCPDSKKSCSSKDLGVAKDVVSKVTCGKSFLVSKKNKVTFDEAHKFCCAKGMALLSIRSEDDINCVTDLFREKDVGGGEELFWTAGTDTGCPGRHSWCTSSVRPVLKWLWRENEPTKNSCVLAMLPEPEESGQYMEVQLISRNCSTQAFFICEEESDYTYPSLFKPCNQTCANDPGVYGPIKTICGQDYYIGKTKRSWASSEDSCCEDRMELAIIDSNEEFDCLRDLLAASSESWKSGPFWVGGTDQNCPLNFAWCSATKKHPMGTRYQKIIRNTRKSSSCVAVDLNPQKPALVAYKCDQSFKYICKDSRGCTPQCPVLSPCGSLYKPEKVVSRPKRAADDDDDDDDKTPTKTQSNEESNIVQMGPATFQTFKACGRTYLISDTVATVAEAMAQCCIKNMVLFASESKMEGDCLFSTFMKSRPGLNATSYWTSGTDFECKGRFVWCSTGEIFNPMDFSVLRLSSEPRKDCMALEVDTRKKNYALKDDLCTLRQRFICELPAWRLN